MIEEAAVRLDTAYLEGRLVPLVLHGASLDDAYAVQEALVARRVARGERVAGMKMGLTSRAKMRQMGVDTPIYGALTDAMLVSDGAVLEPAHFVQARIEPEICFRLRADLAGPVTSAEALRAVDAACAALEVLDSRYEDFKFDLSNVVADNASGARVVLGDRWTSVRDLRLETLGIVLEVNGKTAEVASSAAVYDHPARSLAELATLMSRRGQTLRAGWIVMTGGATAAVPFRSGDHVRVRVESIGSASVRML